MENWAKEKGWKGSVCALCGGPCEKLKDGKIIHIDFNGNPSPLEDKHHTATLLTEMDTKDIKKLK